MLFNSYQFLLFFPIVVIINYILPHKWRNIWLLVCSYFFYGCWNWNYTGLILTITMISYLAGKKIDNINDNKIKKRILIISVSLCLGMLAYFKYLGFIFRSINGLINIAGIPYRFNMIDVILPVGISFYTFQAIGYIVDIWHGGGCRKKLR